MTDTVAVALVKAKKVAKSEKPATHPKYNEMITAAITALKERSGSSRQAIFKYLCANNKVGENTTAINAHLNQALATGVKSGAIKQSKGTGASGLFKLGEVKKAAKKATKPKAAKPKKAKTPKKKVAAKKPAAKKIVNDSVHGHIQLDPLCVDIIDTPQFQRLRRLKQLGSAYYVYPGASHNRFEHSIGVCHLAGRFVELLKANQPELKISEKDVLCVKIAGLCHDLGHGPFSHLFETFVNESQPDDTHWEHEEASIDLFDHLIKSNQKVKDGFLSRKLKKQDKTFIKQLIKGKVITDQNTGRDSDKNFLYQIVANNNNGIDVDKWDYFARDCHMLGIGHNFDHQRCMQVARVCDVNIDRKKEKHICFRDKDQFNMYEMFHTRFMLHYRAYKHKTVTLIDAMILDAFKEANDNYRQIPGENNKKKVMSEAIKDMVAYTHLTDDVLYDIGRSTDSALAKSRQIIDRIARRDFYKLVGKATFQREVKGEYIKMKMIKADRELSKADFTVTVVKFDYGKKTKNPLNNVYYYRKSAPDKGIKLLQTSDILTPMKFCEWEIRIIYKKSGDKKGKKNVMKAFTKWMRTTKNRKYKVFNCI